jgi:hypothetical protein
MTSLYMIRGLPGSGKSTLAQKLATKYGCQYYEADQYFMEDGEYRFDPSKLHQAHRWCWQSVFNDLHHGRDVIVSNTFTTIREMRDYFNLANNHRCELVIVECTGNYGSIHGVPEEKMEQMRLRWCSTDDLWIFLENYQALKSVRMYDGNDNV